MLLALAPFILLIGLNLVIGAAVYFLSRPGSSGYASSSTYGFTDLGNNRGEGGPPPVILGKKNRVKPQVISIKTRTTKGVQEIDAVYLVARGQLASMESDKLDRVRINGQAAKNHKNVEVEFRYGTSDQTAIDASGIGTPWDMGGAELRLGADPTVHEIRNAAARTHQILLVARGGIFEVNGKGKQESSAAGVKIEYWDEEDKGFFGTKWNPAGIIDLKTSAADATTIKARPYVDIKAQSDWSRANEEGKYSAAGVVYAIANNRAAVYLQIDLIVPDAIASRITKFRLTGYVANDSNSVRETSWTTTIEVVPDSRTYAGYAVMRLKGIASEEFQGGVPVVELDSTGLLVNDPRTGTSVESENPGVLLREVFRNTAWGLGLHLPSSLLDDGVGGTWRSFMDARDATVTAKLSNGTTRSEALHRLNYVLDAKAPASEHLSALLATCRASIYESQGKVKIAADEAAASVRDFDARLSTTNRRNVLFDGNRSSIVPRQIDESERYNRVRILYVDSEDGYKKKTVQKSASEAVGVTEAERALELQLFGIAYQTQALREAGYHLATAQLCTLALEHRTGWGDADLEPEAKYTVYDDYRWPAGKVFRLLAASWTLAGPSTIRGREYNASVYGDTGDTSTVVKETGTKGTTSAPKSGQSSTPKSGSSAGGTSAKTVVLTFTASAGSGMGTGK